MKNGTGSMPWASALFLGAWRWLIMGFGATTFRQQALNLTRAMGSGLFRSASMEKHEVVP